MPHAVWSGAISFGLVTIPIRVTTATEDHSIRFHQYHLEDQGRIRTRKYCEIEEREVSMAEIGKGYEVSKDTLIAVTDEDLANLPLTTAKAIEIVAFVPYSDIDPIRIGEGYYLEPDGQVATKPYTLLRKALERNSKSAVARFAWRGRERLGLLRVKENAIVLHSMRWPDEIRSSESLAPPAVDVPEEEIKRALALMDALSSDDIPADAAVDRYTEAISDLITAKEKGKTPQRADETEAPPAAVVDLMAALKESVQKAKASRGEGEHAMVHEMPNKKATAKKAPAHKAPAKKAAAKKTAARKPKRSA
ncbi:Ku protein [Streptomyces sp. NBC_00063]|uniref:non-homologous end joining protein Ku n=1 Tax=Streptomyces sp. NBC_00063 TaxID=2975638 RepID=UPI00224E8CB2|nr:Ku protein [Streptomyces sp. NBC_00063]MCX5441174.1 Ku protein [Streptomyces sp. NBC_00063]